MAHLWEKQSWYPLLRSLEREPLWPLPVTRTLLGQLRSNLFQQNPNFFNLNAWLKERKEGKGYSQSAASRIAAPQAQSTLTCYQGKWNVFSKLCFSKHLDSFKASAPQVADFLLHLFELGRPSSTIEGYWTAIVGALKAHKGVDLGVDSNLSALLRSFHRERPRSPNRLPPWDFWPWSFGL